MNNTFSNSNIFNPANIVTTFRIGLLFLVVIIMNFETPMANFVAAALCGLVFILDRVDGFLAKKLNCRTDFGGILDVAGDRIVENVLWIIFTVKGIFPIWMSAAVISRGFIVDGFRSYALTKGHTTFSMMQAGISWMLVASPVSRLIYALLKMGLFIGAFIYLGFESSADIVWLYALQITGGIVVLSCVARGVFSIKDILPMFQDNSLPFGDSAVSVQGDI